MQIRKTENRDLPALMALYQQARAFMRAQVIPISGQTAIRLKAF